MNCGYDTRQTHYGMAEFVVGVICYVLLFGLIILSGKIIFDSLMWENPRDIGVSDCR